MLPFPLPRVFGSVYCDDGTSTTAASTSRTLGALSSIKQVMQAPESELKRWRRTFDTNAKSVVGDEK